MNDEQYIECKNDLVRMISREALKLSDKLSAGGVALAVLHATIQVVITGLDMPPSVIENAVCMLISAYKDNASLKEAQHKKIEEDKLRAAGKPTMKASLGDLLAAKIKKGG